MIPTRAYALYGSSLDYISLTGKSPIPVNNGNNDTRILKLNWTNAILLAVL